VRWSSQNGHKHDEEITIEADGRKEGASENFAPVRMGEEGGADVAEQRQSQPLEDAAISRYEPQT